MIVKFQTVQFRQFVSVCVSVCLLLSATVFAQDPPRPRLGVPDSGSSDSSGGNAARGTGKVVVSSDEDYLLAASDVIEIVVQDAPELSGNFRISAAGTIPMHYLGTLTVVGKTPYDVSKTIADGLRGRYLKDPKVFVNVAQYNSRTFFVQGAVRNPGVHVIEGKPSLFKLLTIAGGLQEKHGSTAYIIREIKAKPEKLENRGQAGNESVTTRTPVGQAVTDAKGLGTKVSIEGEGEYELRQAKIGGMLRGNFDQNMLIEPGDVVYIPPAEVFYVSGEVKSPGQYQYKEGITLRQAISLAQGMPFKAAGNRGVIYREDPLTGKFSEMPVDISAVYSGKKDDIQILPNDIVVVPNSAVKSVSSALLMALGYGVAARVPIGR